MFWIWAILAMLVVSMWVLALVDIVRRREAMSGTKIAAWVIAVLVFPIAGTIAYLLVHASGGASGAPRDPEIGGRAL